MQNLKYVGKNLFLERVSIHNFLKKNKTPFYIYSENQIVSHFVSIFLNAGIIESLSLEQVLLVKHKNVSSQ